MTVIMTNAYILRALRRARKLISKGWTRHSYARDKRGHAVDCTSCLATKFCLLGALNRVDPSDASTELVRAELVRAELGCTIVDYNDRQKSKKPVIDLIDKTIAKIKAELRFAQDYR